MASAHTAPCPSPQGVYLPPSLLTVWLIPGGGTHRPGGRKAQAPLHAHPRRGSLGVLKHDYY